MAASPTPLETPPIVQLSTSDGNLGRDAAHGTVADVNCALDGNLPGSNDLRIGNGNQFHWRRSA